MRQHDTKMRILLIIILKAAKKIKWIESNAMLSVSLLSSLTFPNHFWLCRFLDRDNEGGDGGGGSGDGKESPHNLTKNKAKI